IYSFVGRLSFDNLDGYSEYAKKAKEFSRPEAWRDDPRALTFTVRTEAAKDAPDDGYKKMMVPMMEASKARQHGSPIPFADMSPEPGMASPDNLLDLAKDPRPTVLMSLSHGEGRSKSQP